MIITIGVNSGGIIGDDLEYFDLYSNNDIIPFKEDVAKSELLDGLQVIAPNGTTQVIVKAKDSLCGDIMITIPVVITPTTTSTTTTSTTTSTTTIEPTTTTSTTTTIEPTTTTSTTTTIEPTTTSTTTTTTMAPVLVSGIISSDSIPVTNCGSPLEIPVWVSTNNQFGALSIGDIVYIDSSGGSIFSGSGNYYTILVGDGMLISATIDQFGVIGGPIFICTQP